MRLIPATCARPYTTAARIRRRTETVDVVYGAWVLDDALVLNGGDYDLADHRQRENGRRMEPVYRSRSVFVGNHFEPLTVTVFVDDYDLCRNDRNDASDS